MGLHMREKWGLEGKRATTNLALVRLDSRMSTTVRLQAALLGKRFPAQVALVGLEARMNEAMTLKMFAQCKRFTTNFTYMIFLPTVYQHVTLQRVVSYKSLVASWTAKFLQLLVLANHHIIRDIDFERVLPICRLRHENAALLTVVAFEFQVANQARRIRIHFVAISTLECFIFYKERTKYFFISFKIFLNGYGNICLF